MDDHILYTFDLNASFASKHNPAIIQLAVFLYIRCTLSLRQVEEMLYVRGIDVSYETVHRWVLKFGGSLQPNT